MAMKTPSFGDAVENYTASPSNPHRIGYFVRLVDRRQHRMNRGWFWELTDKRGEFWLTSPANCRPVTPNRQDGVTLP